MAPLKLASLAVLLMMLATTAGAASVHRPAGEKTGPGNSQFWCIFELVQRPIDSCYPYLLHGRTTTMGGCCKGLLGVMEPCRCDAIRQLVRELDKGFGGEERPTQQQREDMERKAERLPLLCGVAPTKCYMHEDEE